MAFLDDLMMNALGTPDEEEETPSPSQVISQSQAPVATPAMGPAVPPKPSEMLMPQPQQPAAPQQENFFQDDNPPDLADINGTNMKVRLMRAQNQGPLGQDYQPVIDSNAIREEFKKNQQTMDLLRQRISADPNQQTREELERRFGKGWGGFGKRFLTEFMLGMGGSSATQKMMERYTKERDDALKQFDLFSRNQNIMMQTAGRQDTTMSGLMKAEMTNRMNELKLGQKEKFDNFRMEDIANKTAILADNSKTAREASQARIASLTKQNTMLDLTGRINQTNSGVNGHNLALATIMADDKLYQEYKDNPNDSTKWSRELKQAYIKAFNQGSKEYEIAEAQRKEANRSSGTPLRFADGMEYDPVTGRMNKVLFMVDKRNGTFAGKTNLGVNYSKDDQDKIYAAQNAMTRMAEAFDNISNMDQKSRDANFGFIGGSDIIRGMRQAGILSGYDNVKNARDLMTAQGALENWVRSLYEFSGKQINEGEMKAIRGFIANLKNDAQVYESMALISYYRSMINRAAYYPPDNPNLKLKVNPGGNYSDALLKAVYLGLNSSKMKRMGIKNARPVRLDKDGTGNQLAMIINGDIAGLAKNLDMDENSVRNLMKPPKE